jgi:hypothetical protein
MNGRGTKSGKQLYYKEYRLYKKQGNLSPVDAEIGDELAGRGDGTFEGGELGRWEVIAKNPVDDTGVKFLISWP